ncbi:hypothetical protein AVEN_274652-1 [Araneus ventricosus]|uniref:Uncharacterized protein n=1 Tax=Araneus ventricosus TaxID=182803 RepID=A0A4Y2FBY0_ARAVE|nr:hypothetical protein AVEN_274652-1 [Araneus ventricosus]
MISAVFFCADPEGRGTDLGAALALVCAPLLESPLSERAQKYSLQVASGKVKQWESLSLTKIDLTLVLSHSGSLLKGGYPLSG